MKTRILGIFLALVSVSMFAQKNELKAAEKALKKQDYSAALTSVKAAEALKGSMDTRMKAKLYFLQGQTFAGKKDFENAVLAYNNLLAEEKQSGKKKYTISVNQKMQQMLQEVNKKANNLYKSKNFKEASKFFYLTYKLSPRDTVFVFNAALASQQGKDYDQALKYYQELKDMKYTGVTTQYWATNKDTGAKENLGSKRNRDLFVRAKQYKDPFEKKTESKVGEITKNTAYIYKNLGKTDLALKTFEEAKKLFPKDLNILLNEADIYFQLGNRKKFGELMEQAIEQDPTNPTLYFNLGVISNDQKKTEDAIKYYKKAIELKPDYGDAYLNLYNVIIAKQDAVNKEQEKFLTDFDKYDEFEAKKKVIYKEAVPYLQKAYELSKSADLLKTLFNLYEILEMKTEAEKYKAIYKSLQQKN